MKIMPYNAGNLAHRFIDWFDSDRRYAFIVILDTPEEQRMFRSRKYSIGMWLAENVVGHHSCDVSWGPVFFFTRCESVGKFVKYIQQRMRG